MDPMSNTLVFVFYLVALISFAIAILNPTFTSSPRITQLTFVAFGLFMWLFPSWYNAMAAI